MPVAVNEATWRPEVIAAIVGAATAFVLTKTDHWWAQRTATRVRLKAVKQLLILERERNVENVVEYWQREIEYRKDTWYSEDGQLLWMALARAVSATPLPEFSRRCWDSTLTDIPSVYTADELTKAWSELEAFASLHAIRDQLIYLGESAHEAGRAYEMRSGTRASPFIASLVKHGVYGDGAADMARQFLRLVETVAGDRTPSFPPHIAHQAPN